MAPPDPHLARPARSRAARVAWAGLGIACLVVGATGVVLPGLPTTPFLLLAAACFARSSQSLYDHLLAHPRFGPLVRDYRDGLGVPARVKTVAIALMWVFVLFALGPGLPRGNVTLRALVAAAALVGTAYLLRLPTRRVDGRPPQTDPVTAARPSRSRERDPA